MEEWRAIPGFEGFYEVSNLGRVRGLARVIENRLGVRRRWPARILSSFTDGHGYRQVALRSDCNRLNEKVHRLVLLAFVGPAPARHEACHNNGDRADNRLENLRWDNRRGNHSDKIAHGTDFRGERSPTAKLTEEDVRAILNSTEPQSKIAARFGVCQTQVHRIKKGVRWAHLRAA